MHHTRFYGIILLLVSFACAPLPLAAQSTNHDPDEARLVTSDIRNFWSVFDRATLANAVELFQRDYIDAGSPGLRDFVRKRIQNANNLAGNVAARPRFYAAIRNNAIAVDTSRAIKDSVRASFRRLKELYPDAVFPDVYFVIGVVSSAGTTSENGLLIGVEMNARGEDTPVEELGDWARAVTQRIGNLPYIVAHELIHIQQTQDTEPRTLLKQALREGTADFIGEKISGGIINALQHEYGNARESALWEEFQREMSGTDVSRWLFQGDQSKDRPADLGYYIGYKICEAYYNRAEDKAEAIRRILRRTETEEFLKESGYQPSER